MRSFLLLISLTLGVQAQTIRVPLGGGVDMELTRVSAGTFTQGSPTGDPAQWSGEATREVKITQPFYVGRFPVTRGQFARFVAATGYRTEAERGVSGGFGWSGGKLVQNKQFTWRSPGFPQTDDHPVVMVDFSDATAFCAWMSRQCGRQVTLPTEAQWEFAARGGGNAGDAWTSANSPAGTQPVGRGKANGYGLFDMLGNTWEWCEDWMAPIAPGAATDPVQTNPNLADKPRRVLRGGAFSRPAADASVAKRYRNDPGSRNADNGFRVVSFDAQVAIPPAVPASIATPPPRPRVDELERPAAQRERIPGELSIPASPSSEHEAPIQQYTQRQSSGGFDFLKIAIFGIGAVILFKVLRGLFNSQPKPSSFRQPPQSMPRGGATQKSGIFDIRLVPDGFMILGQVGAGTLLRARWTTSTGTQSRTFEYRPSPEGHFVFTGSNPMNISVSVEDDDDSGSGIPLDDPGPRSSFPPRTNRSSRSHPTTTDDGRPFGGYPSAY